MTLTLISELRNLKVIFSRKGFDSAAGGAPSPIIDGRPISMPIPALDRSKTTYGDLGLGELVKQLTKERLNANSLCHHDPMFEQDRCAFGQCGAAQGHLANNHIEVGDVFLFFGLFAGEEKKDAHHRLFGYLRIEDSIALGTKPGRKKQPNGFTRRHPHTIGEWDRNNTLYIGNGTTAKTAPTKLRLTHPSGPLTRWNVPSWLRETGLTYHQNPARWLSDGSLKSASRGQEFIADIAGNRKASYWLARTIERIEAT